MEIDVSGFYGFYPAKEVHRSKNEWRSRRWRCERPTFSFSFHFKSRLAHISICIEWDLIWINSNGSNNCESVVKMSANERTMDDVLKCGYQIHDFYSSRYHYVVCNYAGIRVGLHQQNARTPTTHKCCTWFYRNSKVKRMPEQKDILFLTTRRNATHFMRFIAGLKTVFGIESILGWKHLPTTKDLLHAEYAFS